MYDKDSRRRLAVLRLVNKSFYRSASRLLFRVVRASLGPCVRNQNWPLEGLFQISRSWCAPYVRGIEVGFHSRWESVPEYEFYIHDLSTLLPICLSNFPGLTTLSVRGPSFSFGEKPDPPFSQDLMKLLTNTVVEALRSVPLSELRELTLAFPITYEFNRFLGGQHTASQIPIDNVMRRLRHLRVEICDNTGLGGQLYHSAPLSAAKYAFPNATHASQLFRFIELAENLDSLHLLSTDILNLSGLGGLNFSHKLRLRDLYFSNVSISSENLLYLIEQCKHSICRIEFYRVELNSGTWQDILIMLSRLPSLQYFYICSSGYSRIGGSSDLAPRHLPSMDEPQQIETNSLLDNYALGKLQCQVNANRTARRLQRISEFTYKFLHLCKLCRHR